MTLKSKIRKEVKSSYKKYNCDFYCDNWGKTCTVEEDHGGILYVKLNCNYPDVGFNLSRIILDIQKRFTEMELVIIQGEASENFYTFTVIPWELLD